MDYNRFTNKQDLSERLFAVEYVEGKSLFLAYRQTYTHR